MISLKGIGPGNFLIFNPLFMGSKYRESFSIFKSDIREALRTQIQGPVKTGCLVFVHWPH